MAFSNQDAMDLARVVNWILGVAGYDGKAVTDAAARKSARTLVDRASKTGCCIVNNGHWNRWPKRGAEFEPGICAVCGCTDDRACPEGCFWVNDEHTLCSACAEKLGIIRHTPRAIEKRDRGSQVGNHK